MGRQARGGPRRRRTLSAIDERLLAVPILALGIAWVVFGWALRSRRSVSAAPVA